MVFAKIISIILHPVFMPIIAFYLSLKLTANTQFLNANYMNFIYLILFLSTIVMPLLSIFFLIKKGLVSSLEMNGYKERVLPLIVTTTWMCYGYYKLEGALAFTPLLKRELLCAIIIVFLAALISKFWKISLHMLGVGGCVGVLFSLNILFGGLVYETIASVFLAGVLGFARLRLKAHNNTQVYVGFLTGFSIECGGLLIF